MHLWADEAEIPPATSILYLVLPVLANTGHEQIKAMSEQSEQYD